MIRLLLKDILTFHEQIDKATGIRDCFTALVKNHGFIDGNKRVALHALTVYLKI